jgi:hypothetical protein
MLPGDKVGPTVLPRVCGVCVAKFVVSTDVASPDGVTVTAAAADVVVAAVAAGCGLNNSEGPAVAAASGPG